MAPKIVFGKSLKELLTLRDWSAAKLARQINIDSSLVCKWIRGDRVPSIKANYIEQISDCLSMGLENKEYLKESIINTLMDMGFDIEETKTINEILKEVLATTQIYSLKLDPADRRLKENSREEDIVNLMKKIQPLSKKIDESIPKDQFNLKLTDIPMIIQGREAILRAAITLISEAAKQDIEKTNEISITFQSERDWFEGFDSLSEKWQYEIANVLQKGWDVRHLLRLNKNIKRSSMIIEKILGWLGYKGTYKPCYFNKYNTINPPYEMIIVPGVGALLCLATEGMDYIDTAFFYRQQAGIEALYKYFNQLSSQTKPLLRVFNVDNYFEAITEIDRKPGGIFNVSVDLEFISIPYSLWLKYLRRTLKDEAEILIHANRIQKRIDYFRKYIEKYKFKSIYSVEAIDHLIEKGEYKSYNIYTKATKEDIIENISYLIHLLKKYDNFEIALINDSQSYLIPQKFWRVKGDYNAMITFWGADATLDNVNEKGLFLEINEGTISSAFRDYFIATWERITPKFRDKKYIISWLEEKITFLTENENI